MSAQAFGNAPDNGRGAVDPKRSHEPVTVSRRTPYVRNAHLR